MAVRQNRARMHDPETEALIEAAIAMIAVVAYVLFIFWLFTLAVQENLP